jgi:hypothetical protein
MEQTVTWISVKRRHRLYVTVTMLVSVLMLGLQAFLAENLL